MSGGFEGDGAVCTGSRVPSVGKVVVCAFLVGFVLVVVGVQVGKSGVNPRVVLPLVVLGVPAVLAGVVGVVGWWRRSRVLGLPVVSPGRWLRLLVGM